MCSMPSSRWCPPGDRLEVTFRMAELDRSLRIAASLTRIAGAVAAAIGAFVLVLYVCPWCQTLPTSEPRTLPFALGLLVGGVGLILIAADPHPHNRAALWFARLELLLALVLLLGHAYTTQATAHPATHTWFSMVATTPPAAALCLLMHAGALLLTYGPAGRRWRYPVIATQGSAIVALALVSLLVKALNLASPSAPGQGIDFPPFSAAGLMALGIGLIGLAATRSPPHRTRRAPWLPMCIGIGLAVFTFVVWWELTVFDRLHSQQILSSAAIAIRTHIVSQLRAEADRGERMAHRWEISGGTPRELWEADAAGYIGDLPSLVEILWLDADLKPRWGMPFDVKDVAWAAHAISPRLLPALERARNLRQTTLSSSFMTPNRGTAFLICVPLYIGNRFDGLLATTVSVPEFLHSTLSDSILQGYVAHISDAGRPVFGPHYAADDSHEGERATIRIELSGLTWMLSVQRQAGSPAGVRSSLPEATLIVGLILAALVMLSVHLGQMAAERARELEALNAALERRVAARTADLQRAVADVERSNRELEQFAYVASHDLQEPLRMISSYVQLLARRYKGRLDADADEFIGYAVDGADRMKRLINDLLAYSRLGTHGKPFRPVDLNEVLQLTLRNLEFAIRDVAGDVTSDPLPSIPGDDTQLIQLFQNLIANALKFRSAAPPRVHIAATRAGAAWHFTVRDNGIGIDPKYADRIFIIFRRLHAHSDYPGTGIGLAVCKKIVERHGGRIWVDSQAGQGSTFHMELPADMPPHPAPAG
ncbi:MAG: hypothetical protein K8T26_08065 [Lentisphaerae bacterium]|nr:hypothetical protein [Lentisphaerota bacterium]